MRGFTIEEDGLRRQLVYHLDSTEHVDRFSINMLRSNILEGILPCVYTEKNAMEGVQFDITEYLPLKQHLSNFLTKEQILKILIQVITNIRNIQIYLLDTNLFVIQLQHIYISSDSMSIYLIYLPVYRKESEISIHERVNTLLKEIILSLRFHPGEEHAYISQILNYMNRDIEYSLHELENYLVSFLNNHVEEEIQEVLCSNEEEVVVSQSESKISLFFKRLFFKEEEKEPVQEVIEVKKISFPQWKGEDQNTVLLTPSVEDSGVPYLVRKSTDEKIGITKREFHVGKDERYADYRISDNAAISRAHAEFVLKEGGCYLRDEGSLNHTYINGVELSEQDMKELQIGDVVSFADEEYIFYW